MDRRFECPECGTKWFIHEHRTDEPDLTECGRCGGGLVRFAAPPVDGWYGWRPGDGTGELGQDG